MGEHAASAGATLATIGLGSCIGLALVDGRVAGLAHVVLPSSGGQAGLEPGKYGDLVVPALVDCMLELGAVKPRLAAILVGGAHMFSFTGASTELDVGARNESSVTRELKKHGIALAATATGGDKGRTVRVVPDGGVVVVKEVGGKEYELHRTKGLKEAA